MKTAMYRMCTFPCRVCDRINTPKDKGGEEDVEMQKRNFLASAKKFHKTIKILFNMPWIPTDHPGKIDASHTLTGFFLNAICLELIIKMFWMIEKDEAVPKNHDVLRRFEELDEGTRKHIESVFYNDEQRKESYENLCKSVKEKVGENLPNEEDFRRLLSDCCRIVVDYRYDSSALRKNKFLANQHVSFLGKMLDELEQKINPPAADTQ